MHKFIQVHLRTTDVDAARAFYDAVLGAHAFNIVKLHEHALARGAPPHWLGMIEVADVERATAAFVERGATQLSPRLTSPEGLEMTVLRDPGGAVVAVAAAPAHAREARNAGAVGLGAELVWFLLHTNDVERAKTNYRDLFEWEMKETLNLGSLGVFHPFAWEPGAAAAGSMSDIASRPGVHPHWLFHVRVPDIDKATAAVRASGGVVVDVVTLPSRERIAICDDAQGAAFAMQG